MFGFGKKKKLGKEKKKRSKIDKLIMGAIVGGAVGSVIGMSIAPKKGSETREIIAQKGKELIKKGQESLEKLSDSTERKKIEDDFFHEVSRQKKNIFSRITDRIFGRSKKVKKKIMKDEEMRKIPNEIE